MHKIKGNVWKQSFKELESIRCIAIVALLVALNVTLDLLNIRIWLTPDLRFSVGFTLNASIAMLFGPVVGIMAGFLTDIMGYLVNPVGGGYFPGYTITAMMGGFIYGMFLYPKRPTKLRVLASKASINLFCNICLNTLWLSLTGGQAMMALLPARIIKNVVLLPFEAILLFFITNIVCKVYRSRTLS